MNTLLKAFDTESFGSSVYQLVKCMMEPPVTVKLIGIGHKEHDH